MTSPLRLRQFFNSLLLCLLAAAFCGCAGYRLGPTNGAAAGAHSVQFRPFINLTQEPRLIEAVGSSLRRHLQRDGTYKLETQDDGDIVVTGSILRYSRDPLAFQPRDILTVRDYRLTVVAKVTATERSGGRVLFEREITGRSTMRIGADQTSVERQTLPVLADDLARNIVAQLCEGSW